MIPFESLSFESLVKNLATLSLILANLNLEMGFLIKNVYILSVFTQFSLPSMRSCFCYRWPGSQPRQRHFFFVSLNYLSYFERSWYIIFWIDKRSCWIPRIPSVLLHLSFIWSKPKFIPTSNYFSTRLWPFTI